MRYTRVSRWALAALALSGGCVDGVVEIARPGTSQRAATLSALGVFAGAPAGQVPAAGFVAYEVNAPLYSDGASKRRLVWVPPGARVETTAGRWSLPVGAVLVKTFYFPVDARDPSRGERRIETRFLVRTADGYEAATYLWNDAQTDAVASGGNVDVPVAWVDADGVARRQTWHVPGTSHCDSCHRQRALGLRTPQMDRPGAWDDGARDQLDHLLRAGVIASLPTTRDPLPDPLGDAPLADRARGYLDANCGHCHATDGSAAGTGLYFDLAHTDAAPFRCRATAGVAGADHVLVPGAPEASAMIQRMVSADPFERMPRGPVAVPDGAGVALLSDWIRGLGPAGCP